MPKRAVLQRSRRRLSLDVSVGVHILLVVEQSSLESQSRGCCQDSDTYGIPIAEYNLNKNVSNQPRERKIEFTERLYVATFRWFWSARVLFCPNC